MSALLEPLQLSPERLALLESISLKYGGHKKFEDGVCAMEIAAYVAGEDHSDQPSCVSKVITSFMVAWNDALPTDEERNRLLKPLIPIILGTRTSEADEMRRSWMALDWFVRTFTPAWLRLAGQTYPELLPFAESLSAASEIVDNDGLKAVRPITEAADSAADSAAYSAADSAALEVLNPVAVVLQESAQELVRRMASVGRA